MQQSYITNLLKKPTWMLFLGSWLFYLIGLFLFSRLVWDINTYMSDFKGDNFDQFISNVRRIDILRYALSPVWVIGISAVIWILIKSGLVITQVEFSTPLLFKIIFLGFIFISLPFWVKSVWLILFQSGYIANDVIHFYPGSIVSFIDTNGMGITMEKILSRINLFHLSFMLFTSLCISRNSEMNYLRSFLLILFTYGLGLTLLQCLIFVMIM